MRGSRSLGFDINGLIACAAIAALAAGTAPGLKAQSGGAEGRIGAEKSEAQTLPRRVAIRFLTGQGFPPFNYYDEENILTGFNVDIARAICQAMDAACDIKARPWKKLIPTLKRGGADAIIASQAINPQSLRHVDFTDRYYHTPGRFVALRNSAKLTITPLALEARTIAVTKGTTHEAYIRAFFRDSRVLTFPTVAQARKTLMDGKADLLFGDAISLTLWMHGTISRGCCEFRGGAYSEPRYFGDGIGIAVTKGDRQLRAQINAALKEVRLSGRYEELFLRYFPLKVY